MIWIECIFFSILLLLGILVVRSDVKEGKIYNKTLYLFMLAAIILDIIYYGFINRKMIIPFIINIVVMVVVSFMLFYTHCFAGGDSKLIIVMSLLYPASKYISYKNNLITLVFSIAIALFFGYVFLVGTSVRALVKKENKFSLDYIRQSVIVFAKSFFTALVYISLVSLLLEVFEKNEIYVSAWITRIICIGVSFLVGRYPQLRKKHVMIPFIFLDVVLSMWTKTIPFSIHPENYTLVVLLLLGQMMIRTNLYQEISLEQIKKGMILSMGTSILMQNSRVRGLPKISSESLEDRLTECEVESIKRWGKGKQVEKLTIVKKIPFAIFIVLGFFSYFLAWLLLRKV